MTDFIPGKELCKRFYQTCVASILKENFPTLVYSAGLLGYGSEVLGFDTPLSRDHDWGPRMQIFLNPQDNNKLGESIRRCLASELPYSFEGYSTNFGSPNEADKGTRHMKEKISGLIDHKIVITNLQEYLDDYLPVDALGNMDAVDWLVIPQQKLRTVAFGGKFFDGLNVLEAIQSKLAWYPESVWIYLLASAWSRIGQEEHLVGRCGHVGDELGSSQLGASLTRVMMQLAFLMEKKYAPYPKWFGTAFQKLEIAEELSPALDVIRIADDWQERETGLVAAYLVLIRKMNSLGLIAPIEEKTSLFFGRPFQVIYAGNIAESLKHLQKGSPLGEMPLIGGIDLITSATDVVENNAVCAAMRNLYQKK